MYDSRITPIFTWTVAQQSAVKGASREGEAKNALCQVLPRLVKQSSSSYTIPVTKLRRMIQTFAALYIYDAKKLGLTTFSEADLENALKELGYTSVKLGYAGVEPGYELRLSNYYNRVE